MSPRAPASIGVLAAAALVLSACFPAAQAPRESAGPSGAIGPASAEVRRFLPPDSSPTTRSEQLSAEMASTIAQTGRVSTQQVIDAADVVFGGIPGATASALPPGETLSPGYVRALLRHVTDELTAAQRAAVEQIVNPPADPRGDEPWQPAAAAGDEGESMTDQLTDLAIQVRADWNKKAGIPMWPLLVRAVTTPRPSELAATQLKKDKDGNSYCDIEYFPKNLEALGVDALDIKVTFAHEWMHCYQGLFTTPVELPGWVLDGSLEWAKYYLYPNQRPLNAILVWRSWFSNPSKTLEQLDYAAWPIFSAFEQTGGDAFAAATALFKLKPFPDARTALNSVGMSAPPFTLRWGSMMAMLPATGSWSLRWPNGTPAVSALARQVEPVTPGAFEIAGDPGITVQVFDTPMDRSVDVLTLVAGPRGAALRVGTGIATLPEGEPQTFCLREGGCACPDAAGPQQLPSRDIVTAFDPLSALKVIKGYAAEWDPDRFCPKKESGSHPATATSNGDPHLMTYDGYAFDVMSEGEFITTKDPSGGFEVQTRHQAMDVGADLGPLARIAAAVGTSAVAVSIGGRRVTLTADRFSADRKDVVIRVDGGPVRVPFAADGVSIAQSTKDGHPVWTITGPDGSSVVAMWWLGFFVTAAPDADRAGRLVGLLGAANGDATDDLRLPDGSRLPPDADLEADYAQAWLVDQRSSLFDYAPGQSPQFFHRAPPSLDSLMDALFAFFGGLTSAAPGADVADAYEQCSAAIGPAGTRLELRSCTYDAAVTGRSGFSDIYAADSEQRLGDDEWFWQFFPPEEPPPPAVQPRDSRPALVLDAASKTRGAIVVPAGAVLTFRTGDCGGGLVRVEPKDARGAVLDYAALCRNDPLNSSFPVGDMREGEVYQYAGNAGSYSFEIDPDLVPRGARVEVYVDPTPSLDDQHRSAPAVSGTVSGTGDAEIFVVENPDAAAWTQRSPGDGVCVLVAPTYLEPGGASGLHALGGGCFRGTSVGVPITFEGLYPAAIVVVARTDATTGFAVSRG